jgi:hypothetical protein
MGLNNLSDWDRSGQLSPYPQSAGQQMVNPLMALIKMFQANQKDKALRQAAGGMMGGTEVPQGVDAGKLFSDLALEKNKTFAPQAPNETQQLLDFISKGQGMGGVLNNAAQPGSEMPGTVPAEASAAPSGDMLMRGLMSKKFGIPYESMATPEEKQLAQQDELSMVKQKADIAEKARGIDPMYKKQVEIFKDVLRHRGELEGLLFQGEGKWQPGVKVHSPYNANAQRFSELLKEAETAKKLLSARNVQGDTGSGSPMTGIMGQGVGAFTNPIALKKNLDDLYTTIGAATENIEPGSVQAPIQGGNTFATEQEALASGIKGEVIIGGRRARID